MRDTRTVNISNFNPSLAQKRSNLDINAKIEIRFCNTRKVKISNFNLPVLKIDQLNLNIQICILQNLIEHVRRFEGQCQYFIFPPSPFPPPPLKKAKPTDKLKNSNLHTS